MSENLNDPEIEGYYKRHKRIRGSHELKYPPKESRCRRACGTLHYEVDTRKAKEYREHPCFLAIGHEGPCEFSSECAQLFTGQIAA